MNKGPSTSVAIVGAALRYPGAIDLASFHDLVMSGRRMFSNVPQVIGSRETTYAREAVPASYLLRAALLDYPSPGETPVRIPQETPAGKATIPGASALNRQPQPNTTAAATGVRANRAAGGPPSEFGIAGARHLLAAETAASALADVPASARPVRPGGTGAIIAGTLEPGAPDVAQWVRDRLGLALPGGTPLVPCSLRAIALACDMLVAGKLDLALAGGVSMGVDPAWHDYRVHLGAAAGEDTRIYDSNPTGGLPGEGCGVAALMRAADARDAGLPIYAEIVGWHAGDDVTAQSDIIRGAYLRAGIDPADVQFVEGHGASTAVEDLAELTALLDVLAPRHDGAPGQCALGSVTANVGDTRAAAGAAALLKTTLAMAAGIIPPTTGCVRPHQLLRAGATPFRLPAAPEPWPETTTRLAAVNTLGAARSGPVHLVLRREHDPQLPAGRRHRVAHLFRDTTPPGPPRASAAAWPGTEAQAEPSAVPLLTAPQPRLPHGAGGETVVAIRGSDTADLAVMLDAVAAAARHLCARELRELALELAAAPHAGDFRSRAAIVASDPGQLAERARRGAAQLRANPNARTAGTGIHLSSRATGRVVLLFPGLVSTAVEQSAVLSASMAALDTAERLGIRACAGVGYSFGEITALAWAGAITFGEAARFAAHRAQIIRAMPSRAAMARVRAASHVVAQLCEGTGLTLATQEGPRQHVVAGPVAEIRDLPQRAAILGADVELLSTTHALHSPAMAPSVAPMRAAMAGLRFTAPRRRLVSTVTGLDVTGPDLTGPADPAELVAAQLARPALLAGALALAGADADLILLTAHDPALAEAAGAGGRVPVVQAPLEQRSGPVMTALAAFYAAGAIDNLRPFLPEPEPSSDVSAPDAPPAGSQEGDSGREKLGRSAEKSAAADAEPQGGTDADPPPEGD